MLSIAEELNGAVAVVGVTGRVDSSTAKALEDKLTGLFRSGCSRVVVDLKHLVYISSAGLRALMMASRLARNSNGQFALCNLTADVMQVFELGGLTELFVICASREEGLAKLA